MQAIRDAIEDLSLFHHSKVVFLATNVVVGTLQVVM
jgi:hypothetical protein